MHKTILPRSILPRTILPKIIFCSIAWFVIASAAVNARGNFELDPLPRGKLLNAQLSLNNSWLFHTDPQDMGIAHGWFENSHNVSSWMPLDAGLSWESQGIVGYDGVAWYIKDVFIPLEWRNHRTAFISNGIDDTYSLYVNGVLVKHSGEDSPASLWKQRTEANISHAVNPGETNRIAIRVVDWSGDGGIWRNLYLKREVPFEQFKNLLPQPVLTGNESLKELYFTAWQLAWKNIAAGTSENGFSELYLDEGFNEQIYQWDTVFMTLFGKYGLRLFPVMASLDNFYARQHFDGYIQRVYHETNGSEVASPSSEELLVNPPLFAWAEWSYFKFTGDKSRLEKYYDSLNRYYYWFKTHLRSPHNPELYWQTELGSGMDNTPRPHAHKSGWTDSSMQQALAALYLGKISHVLGNEEELNSWKTEYRNLKETINQKLWNTHDGFYFDLNRDGNHTGVKHIGAYWALLAQISDQSQITELVRHLHDPNHFNRRHLFPTLSASDPVYSSSGHYWRGGVWAPTNYMVIKGLEVNQHKRFAREASLNHVQNLDLIYRGFIDTDNVHPLEQDGSYRTLWETYAPDAVSPGTRWDNRYYGRQDFVGWTGLGPIALLIENILGFEVLGHDNKIIWNISRIDTHGLSNLPLGENNLVDLVAEARSHEDSPIRIQGQTNEAFTLDVVTSDGRYKRFTIEPGTIDVTVNR